MIEELNSLNIEYYLDKDLTNYNTMKLVSRCFMFVLPKSVDELILVLDIIKRYDNKYFILGNGSNTILPKYYNGVIIKLSNFNRLIYYDNYLYVESGYMLNKLSIDLSNKGYDSLVWATHIPGTIGGAIYSNAGAYNEQISNYIIDITVLSNGKVKIISKEDALFEYRSSIFRVNKDLIILGCSINVKMGDILEIKDMIKERLEKRIASQPLDKPSCGSVFRNPSGYYAGRLIEEVGLKGITSGDLEISKKHANFIINNGKGNQDDYLKLIDIINKKIKDKYNIDLILEQEILNE